MFHYTNSKGYKAIGATAAWHFRASKPPGDHPVGAYFTDYGLDTPLLAIKLRVPLEKLEFFFEFNDAGDLQRLPGGRGKHIFFSPTDYVVDRPRQRGSGKRKS